MVKKPILFRLATCHLSESSMKNSGFFTGMSLVNFSGFDQEYFLDLTFFEALESFDQSNRFKELENRFTRLSTYTHPIINPVFLQLDREGVCARIVRTDDFQEAAIARAFLISHHLSLIHI